MSRLPKPATENVMPLCPDLACRNPIPEGRGASVPGKPRPDGLGLRAAGADGVHQAAKGCRHA